MNTTETQLRYTDEEYIQPPHGFCPGCGVALALRYFLKAVGEKVIIVAPPGCAAPSISFPKPSLVYEGRRIDVIHCPFGSAAIIAGGIKSALVARGDTETQVVAWAGDGATFDIGFGGVSAAAERNENIIYVCYDNEAYMNTGNQRSGATPWGAKTATNPPPDQKSENKKDIMWIMMGHYPPYTASATVAYPDDLMTKARKAKEISGFRFFHILTPCIPGWGYRSELTVKISRLAVQTNLFPLYEIEDGTKITINKKPKAKKLEEFVKLQGRFKHLTSHEIKQMQTLVEKRWDRLNRLADLRE
ncbi:MAG TPA: thiamine pyrophosphate-dependent enzyme [Desulfatiglandales bacterium]|nr:thiamine pyrophosphate-dependent enzyme [Desulfatiglandales bacterium]